MQPRWREVNLPQNDAAILFAHIPDYVKPQTGMSNKEIFWQYLVDYAGRHSQDKMLFLGDLNTGLPADGSGFRCAKYFKELIGLGYLDMWRHYHPNATEFTWYSRCNGFRLDHAFTSPPMLPFVRNVLYSHSEREEGISDHSILIADIML